MKMLKETLLISSVATDDEATKNCMKLFGSSKVIVVHTDPVKAKEKKMQEKILENLNRIREYIDTEMEEIVVDIYDFYKNVQIFRQLIADHGDYRIILNVTGGDKCVSDAMIYASLIVNVPDVLMVYFKRKKDTINIPVSNHFVVYPKIPVLPEKQEEFMFYLGNGDSINNMAEKLGTKKANCWNLARALSEKGLVSVDSGMVTASYPENFYSPVKESSKIENEMMEEEENGNENTG
jgi:CRISPR locus-related DNA-binding protein